MGTTRFWLFLFLGQIAVLAVLAWLGEDRTPAPLRWLGIACIVGIFLSAPALVVKSFVAGQRRVGNADLSMVRGVQRNEVALIVGAWVLMGAALAMAWPTIKRDIAADRRANAADTMVLATPAEIAAMSAPPPSAVPESDSRVDDPAVTPAAGSPERAAILDALRTRLETTSRFKVDHLKLSGEWAFVRATEIVELDGHEQQETDLTVAALLEKPKGSTTGWWRIADYWTLPENDQKPLADFTRRVKQRVTAERLPAALLPDDL
ncbi:MAG TPA: hypothetical protein VFS59_11715 [Gemmatimonadaceae bacterium]|nr:hypothetical protein [Gemmatimonadaceae bacterium]